MKGQTPKVIRLHASDTVITAGEAVIAGSEVEGMIVKDDIRSGHRIACVPMSIGEPVRKYANVIGFASVPIAPGTLLHRH